mgnify:CR=1 FL=1
MGAILVKTRKGTKIGFPKKSEEGNNWRFSSFGFLFTLWFFRRHWILDRRYPKGQTRQFVRGQSILVIKHKLLSLWFISLRSFFLQYKLMVIFDITLTFISLYQRKFLGVAWFHLFHWILSNNNLHGLSKVHMYKFSYWISIGS